MATRKVSITLDADVLDSVRSIAGGNLSGFVNDALAQRIRQEHLREMLNADEVLDGEPDPDIVEDVRAKWPA